MKIKTEVIDGVVVFRIRGTCFSRLNVNGDKHLLIDTLNAYIATAGNNQFVVDLTNAKRIGHTMLGALIAGKNSVAKNGGMLHISGASPQFKTILENTKLSKYFQTFETLNNALTSFREV